VGWRAPRGIVGLRSKYGGWRTGDAAQRMDGAGRLAGGRVSPPSPHLRQAYGGQASLWRAASARSVGGSLRNSRIGMPAVGLAEAGGEGGIRTPGRFPYARFPSGYFKPLSHLSGVARLPCLQRHHSLSAKGQRRASRWHGSMENPYAEGRDDYFAKCHLHAPGGFLTLGVIFLRNPTNTWLRHTPNWALTAR